MPEKRPTWEGIERDRDESVKLPLDPEAALRGLLAVDPDSESADPSGRLTEDAAPKSHE
jgi:hypothetical protein